jgi:hypothetical protein
MFWQKKLNKINAKLGLRSRLHRDPRRLKFFNNLSVEARPCALRSPGVW